MATQLTPTSGGLVNHTVYAGAWTAPESRWRRLLAPFHRFKLRVSARGLEWSIGNALLMSSLRGEADPANIALQEFAWELSKLTAELPTGRQLPSYPEWLRRGRP